jgi:predicted small lipoprotein YifL
MKRILSAVLILILMMSTLSGCGTTGKNAQSAKDNEVLTQLNAMKEQNKKPKEMFEFLNQNIKEMNKASATEAAGILVNVLEEYETTYNEQLYTGNIPDLMYQYFEFAFDYSKIESIKESELKALLYDIALGGFKIVDAEGTFMVIVDYDALKTFNEYIEDELKTYIDIMSLMYSDPVAIDASIMVNPEELEKRIIQMEDYIKTYDDPRRTEIMTSLYLGYMMVYMSGTDNTPIFDYDSGTMNADMFKTFEKAAATHKDTIFGKVMSKYVQILKQESFTNTEKVQDFILNIDIAVSDELAKEKKK